LPADPVSPRKPIYLALGALIGLAVGVGGAVLRSLLDRRIRSPAVAVATASAPVLGKIAEHPDRGIPPVMLADPLSAGADGYRELGANLRAVSAEHDLRSFVVSSAVAAEGKTEVVANLGIALAQSGARVVVVDANLRSPRLGDLLGVESSKGLTDLIAAPRPIESTETPDLPLTIWVLLALHRHPTAPLAVLTSGSVQPNPSELLDSKTFDEVLHALTELFDFVIVDSPALLSVADAAILARHASAVILVARAASTNTDELEAARRVLHAVETRALGVVLNRVRERDDRLYREEDPPAPGRSRSRTVARARDRQESGEWLF
jgi:capsular exopolysaccharide synthesis family protein